MGILISIEVSISTKYSLKIVFLKNIKNFKIWPLYWYVKQLPNSNFKDDCIIEEKIDKT